MGDNGKTCGYVRYLLAPAVALPRHVLSFPLLNTAATRTLITHMSSLMQGERRVPDAVGYRAAALQRGEGVGRRQLRHALGRKVRIAAPHAARTRMNCAFILLTFSLLSVLQSDQGLLVPARDHGGRAVRLPVRAHDRQLLLQRHLQQLHQLRGRVPAQVLQVRRLWGSLSALPMLSCSVP